MTLELKYVLPKKNAKKQVKLSTNKVLTEMPP